MERASRGVRIVLVRARNPLNIGAAARAMANFGFDDLVVVRPHAPVWREARSAVGAEAVVRGRPVPPPATLRVHASAPAPMHSLEHVFERAVRLLDLAGYLKPKSRAATLLKLRRLLLDLELSNNDVKILGGVLAQLEWRIKP